MEKSRRFIGALKQLVACTYNLDFNFNFLTCFRWMANWVYSLKFTKLRLLVVLLKSGEEICYKLSLVVTTTQQIAV